MPKWTRLDVYQRDDFKCVYCGFDGQTFDGWRYLTIDHIDPKGPRHDLENLATCCRYCNSCKGDDPCLSVEEAKQIVQRHDAANRTYWANNVKDRVGKLLEGLPSPT
jgi:hypothetical protein